MVRIALPRVMRYSMLLVLFVCLWCLHAALHVLFGHPDHIIVPTDRLDHMMYVSGWAARFPRAEYWGLEGIRLPGAKYERVLTMEVGKMPSTVPCLVTSWRASSCEQCLLLYAFLHVCPHAHGLSPGYDNLELFCLLLPPLRTYASQSFPEEWRGELDLCILQANPWFRESFMLHRASKTVFALASITEMTDANFEHPLLRRIARMTGYMDSVRKRSGSFQVPEFHHTSRACI